MPRRSSLARLMRAVLALQILAACGAAAWRWPHSPWQGIGLAALVMAVAPIALALEFCIIAYVTRTDTLPVPSAGQLLRAWLAETAQLFRTFYFRQPFRWRAEDDHLPRDGAGRQGVVLVHGFMCNRGFWNAWMRELRHTGHPFVAINLEPVYGSIDGYADAMESAVQQVARCTGRAPVLVCHSMGGLAARAWWRRFGAEGRIAHLVTRGSPHRGTWLARFSARHNGMQMRLRCDWLIALADDEKRRPLPPATCWHSSCDNVVFPASTATLPGADNRFLPGLPHVALAFEPQVRRACLALLSELEARRQGESFTGPAHLNL